MIIKKIRKIISMGFTVLACHLTIVEGASGEKSAYGLIIVDSDSSIEKLDKSNPISDDSISVAVPLSPTDDSYNTGLECLGCGGALLCGGIICASLAVFLPVAIVFMVSGVLLALEGFSLLIQPLFKNDPYYI